MKRPRRNEGIYDVVPARCRKGQGKWGKERMNSRGRRGWMGAPFEYWVSLPPSVPAAAATTASLRNFGYKLRLWADDGLEICPRKGSDERTKTSLVGRGHEEQTARRIQTEMSHVRRFNIFPALNQSKQRSCEKREMDVKWGTCEDNPRSGGGRLSGLTTGVASTTQAIGLRAGDSCMTFMAQCVIRSEDGKRQRSVLGNPTNRFASAHPSSL